MAAAISRGKKPLLAGCLRYGLAVVLCNLTAILAARAGEARPTTPAKGLIPSPEPGWPQWRGPRRDGLCDETGLLQQWPPAGPELLWKSPGLGRGYCAPILTGGRMYLTGDLGEDLHIFALDLQGKRVWQAKNGRSWKGPYPGARASCTFSAGRLYLMNAHGRVACLDAATGAELWAVDVLERFGGKALTWGLSENLLVDGERVIVTPGGAKALMAALDKLTGATVWTTEALRLGKLDDPAQERLPEPAGEFDNASYSSPILFALGGRRHIVGCSLRHFFGVDADTGQLLWTRPVPTRYQVIAATPVLAGDAVFCTAPETVGGGLYRIHTEGRAISIEKLWAAPLDTCHGGLVCKDGVLYGSGYRREKQWAALDARTGAVRCQLKDLAMGSVLYADDRLYCLSQQGEMALLKPTPTAFEYAGRFRLVPEITSDAWTHPVILDGRLHLRYHETLFCYDIRAR
ncbi:MAG: PQQ-binding-like beta-propeller repeat protein [Planctomycetota bacterium]